MSDFIIEPLLITLHHNLETNSKPVELTSDIFMFDSETSTLPFNKYPFLCSNAKLNIKTIEILEHKKRVEVFFNFDVFKTNLLQIDASTAAEKANTIIKYNIDVMLSFLFPISLPVYKKIKYASKPNDIVSFFEAVVKIAEPYISRKPNNEMTNIKINGETCAVDAAIVLDTLDKNPAYFQTQLLTKKYVTTLLPAAMKVWKDSYVSKLQQNNINDAYYKDATTFANNVIAYTKKLDIANLKETIDTYRTTYNLNTKFENTTINGTNLNVNKIMGLGYMLTTILTSLKNNTAEQAFGLSGIDFRKNSEFNFRQSTAIIETLRQNYYPIRESTNQNIVKIFKADTDIIDIFKLYKCITESSKPENLVLIDRINIGDGKMDTPKYNINLRILVAEGQVTTDLVDLLECYYSNSAIGSELEKNKLGLRNPRAVNLKERVAKISEQRKKTKGNNKPQAQAQVRAQTQAQAQAQAQGQEQGLAQAQAQQQQQQQISKPEDTSLISMYFNTIGIEKSKPIQEKDFIDYVVNKDLKKYFGKKFDEKLIESLNTINKDFIDFLNKVIEYKNKNANDINQNTNETYGQEYMSLYTSLASKLKAASKIFDTKMGTNKTSDEIFKLQNEKKKIQIMLDIVNYIHTKEMQAFHSTQKGGKRTRKYRGKKRRQRRTLRK